MNSKTNYILKSIPEKEHEIIKRNIKLVSLTKNQILFDFGQSPLHAFFPAGAIVSMINDMPDGSHIEAHMLGKSSMVCTGAIGLPSFYRATVRSSGLAYRMDMATLHRVKAECPVFTQNVHQALQYVLMQLSLTVVCSKKHSMDQQLIRWILLTMDNSLSSTIPITHLELSSLLGFRREAVSLMMNKLAKKKWIEKSRGAFTVIDRNNLEMAACDCYWIGQGKMRPNYREQKQ